MVGQAALTDGRRGGRRTLSLSLEKSVYLLKTTQLSSAVFLTRTLNTCEETTQQIFRVLHLHIQTHNDHIKRQQCTMAHKDRGVDWHHTVNLALSSITSYPSRVGVIGLSSSCRLLNGSEMDRGQLEYSTDGSITPFTLARVTWLWGGGGVLLRLPRPVERDWRRKAPHPPPWSSRAALVMGEEDGLPETLPSDEAR